MIMKLHKTLVEAVADALTDIFQQGKYADKVIENALRSNAKWGSRDRAFIAETTYDCVRWWRLLSEVSGRKVPTSDFSRGDFLEVVGTFLVLKEKQNSDFPDFKNLKYDVLSERKAAITERKVLESIPDWLDELGVAELGEEQWTKELNALNAPNSVVLRCNTLKTTVLDLQKKFTAIGFETEKTALNTEGVLLKRRGNVFSTELFKQGLFEVQDAGSQLIAPFLEVSSGMRVVDACAGAGGKTLHLATLMNNKGTLIALDTEGWKLEELKKRARRNGVHVIEARTIESTKTIKRLHNSADRLLLDVPCSGIGVFRRNPDAKWKLTPDFMDNVRQIQAKILADYSKIIKVGGKLVYATCSILPSENELQVQRFLSENPNFKFIAERKVSPAVDGFDGFYMARLERIA
jgi:16S rRNA (cytosine967-C5)-methyltransferase